MDEKLGVQFQIQVDIDKLDYAMGLLKEVNETLSEAFWMYTESAKSIPSTGSSAGTAPMKLARSISDVVMVKKALEDFKEKL